MNKNIKKISSMIEGKEIQNREIIAKAEAEIKQCDEKLASLHTALDKADNAEQYKLLLQEIRDYEATKEFCSKKFKEAKNPSLSNEEYNNIIKMIRACFDEIQKESRAVFLPEIEKLLNTFWEYDSEVTEINNLLNKVSVLGKRDSPVALNPRNVLADTPEKQIFIDACYKAKDFQFLKERYKM